MPHLPIAADETAVVDVLNPSAVSVTVAVDAVAGGLLRPFRHLTLAPLSVAGIALPVPVASAVVRVISPSDSAVVADALTVYAHSQGTTLVSGVSALSVDGYLPGSSHMDHAYVMALNPGPQTTQVVLSGLDGTGQLFAETRLTLPPGTQAQVDLALGPLGTSQIVRVRSTQPAAFHYVGLLGPSGEISLAATYRGSVSTALVQPARMIGFAAGDTHHAASDPREWLLLYNPQAAPAAKARGC